MSPTIDVWKLELFIRICVVYATFGGLKLKADELICLIEECLAVALFLDDYLTQNISYVSLGPLYEQVHQIGKAIEYYKRWLHIAKEILGDKYQEFAAYERLGNANSLRGNLHEATNYHEKCLNTAKGMGYKKGEGVAYGNLGNDYQLLAKYLKAIEYYEKCLAFAMEIGDRQIEGIAYDGLGTAYESLGKYQKAIEYQEKHLGIAIEISDVAEEAGAYGKLGTIYQSSGNPKKAIEYHQKSLGIAVRISDRKKEGSAYGHFGNAYLSLGNYHKAIEYYEKCLSIAIEIADRREEGNAYGSLGTAYKSLGKYQKAIEYQEKHLGIAIEISDSAGEASAYGNLGKIYQSLGNYQKAIEYQEKSLGIAVRISDRKGEGSVYANLGTAYESLGKNQMAIEYHEKHLRIAIEISDRAGEAGAYGNLGITYQSLGNSQKAIEYHKKSLGIAVRIGDRNGEGTVYANLGNAYQSLGKYPEALDYYDKGLKIAMELDDKEGVVTAYTNIGTTHESLGKYQEAIQYQEKSIAIAKEIGHRRGEEYAIGNLGNVYMSLGKYHEAFKHYEESLRIAIEINDRDGQAKVHFYIGRCYESLEKQQDSDQSPNMKKAESHLKKSIQVFESLFDDLELDHYKISIINTFIQAYRTLAHVYVQTQQTEEALLVSDRGRARALRDLLTSKYSTRKEATSKRRSIEVTDIQMILSTCNFGVLFYALQRAIYIWVLAHQNPLYFHQSEIKGFGSTKPSLLSEVNSEATNEEFIFNLVKKSYDKMKVREGIKCEDRSLGLLEGEDHDIENDPVLPQFDEKQKTTKGREAGKKTNKTDDRCIYDEDHDDEDHDEKPLELLYDALVAPVQHRLLQDEIVIIPDGALNIVPFAALQDPKTGQFLSETKRIRLAPSLTTLKVLQESPDDQHYKSGALIVGNPKIGKVKFEGNEKWFDDLPGADDEAKEIAKLLGVKPLTGRQATKEAVLQKLRVGVSVIHFAAHGSENGGKILLAPSPSSVTKRIPDKEDFVLTTEEAQDSGIRAQLVVLSCCHSGRGEINAEGVVGMSRAFLAAGARAVVASLWAIEDAATKVFMLKFYSHLKRGESASKSLQQTMKEMRETERYKEPRNWAAFFLIGDDVTISV